MSAPSKNCESVVVMRGGPYFRSFSHHDGGSLDQARRFNTKHEAEAFVSDHEIWFLNFGGGSMPSVVDVPGDESISPDLDSAVTKRAFEQLLGLARNVVRERQAQIKHARESSAMCKLARWMDAWGEIEVVCPGCQDPSVHQ